MTKTTPNGFNSFHTKWGKWINTGLLLTISIMIWNASIVITTLTFTTVENKVATEKIIQDVQNLQKLDSLSQHIHNEEIHKPYAVMNKLWVPRVEIDSTDREMMKAINQIHSQVFSINSKINQTNEMLRSIYNQNKN